jgi:hypothetical protein
LKSFHWKNQFSEILSCAEGEKSPFVVHSFNTTDSSFIYPEIKLKIIRFNHDELVTNLLNPDYREQYQELSLGEYIERASQEQEFKLFHRCSENLIPEPMVPLFKHLFPGDREHYYRYFYGFQGQRVSAHLDWTSYHNILLQLTGKKEIIILPPSTFHNLPFVRHFLKTAPEELENYAISRGLSYYKVTIGPNEGVYIPPYHVHSANYLTDASSLSLRFNPHPLLERLQLRLPGNNILACIFALRDDNLAGRIEVTDGYQKMTAQYQRVFRQAFPNEPMPEVNSESFLAEEIMFKRMKSFDHQLRNKLRRQEIIERGAANLRL